jgi:hypothetical protein
MCRAEVSLPLRVGLGESAIGGQDRGTEPVGDPTAGGLRELGNGGDGWPRRVRGVELT